MFIFFGFFPSTFLEFFYFLVETIPANSMMLNVNLSQYSEGTYFFNIRQSDGTVSNQRVVVNH